MRSRNLAITIVVSTAVLLSASAVAAPKDYDGQWTGSYMCANFTGPTRVRPKVENGRLSIQVRWEGLNVDLTGQVGEDGSVRISGSHNHKTGIELRFSGKATADRMQGAGTGNTFAGGAGAGMSRCTFEFELAVPDPESLQGKALAAARPRDQGPDPEQTALLKKVYESVAQQAADADDAPDPYAGTVFAKRPPGSAPPAVAQATVAPPEPAPASAPPSQVAGPAKAQPLLSPTRCVLPAVAVRSARGADLRPKLYVLSVGVSRYVEAAMNLSFAAKDACDLARALATQQGGLYREVEIRVVQDEDATREGVLDGLDWITRQTTARDVAMVFLAGHGVNDAVGEYFFLPHDANLERLARSSLPQSDIRRSLMQVPGKALFFFDTCHSGQIMASRRALPPDVSRFVEALATAENSVVVFSASTGRQFAVEDGRWRNGAFTKALLEGLAGQADYKKDKVITINELELYLSERVKELTGGRQAPTTAKPASTQDFPIVVVR